MKSMMHLYFDSLNADATFYVPMAKIVTQIPITVEAPICGTETSFEREGYVVNPDTAVNMPVVTIEGGVAQPYGSTAAQRFWWVTEDAESHHDIFNGRFVGGSKYGVFLQLAPAFGYGFDEENPPTIKVNGTVPEKILSAASNGIADHDWGEWEVVKAPTVAAEGEEQRVCRLCGEVETRAIPKLAPEFFVLTFKLNGGTLDGKTTVVYKGYKDGTTITMPLPTRAGYRFLYWEGSKYYAGQEYTITEDHTFTAVWEKIATPTPAPKTGGKTAPKTPATGDPTTLAWAGVLAAGAASTLLGKAARRRED